MFYITHFENGTQTKNNLQKTIYAVLRTKYDKVLIHETDFGLFKKVLKNEIDELNKMYKNCKPVVAEFYFPCSSTGICYLNLEFCRLNIYQSKTEFKR